MESDATLGEGGGDCVEGRLMTEVVQGVEERGVHGDAIGGAVGWGDEVEENGGGA